MKLSIKLITYNNWGNSVCLRPHPEAHLELCETSNMQSFAKVVNAFILLTIFTKHSILDIDTVLNTPVASAILN